MGLLDPPYDTNRDLILTAIEGIEKVFDLNTVQSDFCRLFAKSNLLPRLMHVLQFFTAEPKYSAKCVQRIVSIFLVFATNGDQVVKEAMSDLTVLRGIMRLLKETPRGTSDENQQLVLTLLKCIDNLCMTSSCLDNLDAAGTIPTLVPFLAINER